MSNPYEAPQTVDLAPIVESMNVEPLASPWMRLLAQIIDMIIIMIIVVPIVAVLGFLSEMQYAKQHGQFFESTLFDVGFGLFYVFVYIAINWVFLANGQTIGKKITKLQIRMKNGQPAPRMRIITHRYLPVQLVALIPCGGILGLVDSLLIFREQRNTLHDDIADTMVVQLS